MEFDLKNLSQTLVLGGLGVYAILFLVRVLRRGETAKFFTSREEKVAVQEAAVYLAVFFSAGILLEDVSKNVVAERKGWLIKPFQSLLGTDKILRFNALFDEVTDGDKKLLKPKPLVCELVTAPYSGPPAPFNELRKLISDPIKCPPFPYPGDDDLEKLKNAVNDIYYHAKNRVFMQQTYFQDVRERQNRLDFTRAFTLLCCIISFIYVVLSVICLSPGIRQRLRVTPHEHGKVFLLCVLYLFGAALSRTAYRSEHTSVDQRVFGYSRTLLYEAHNSNSPKPTANAQAAPSPTED